LPSAASNWRSSGWVTRTRWTVIGVIPIMQVASVAALDEVPEDLQLCARTLGASGSYTLLHVQLRLLLKLVYPDARSAYILMVRRQ
jgi:ABC-type spermidine/putrescine transport system permease subunit II